MDVKNGKITKISFRLDKMSEQKFTIEEFRNYILSQASLRDVMYYLSAEKVLKANEYEPQEYTLNQYVRMAESFNKMSFKQKIEILLLHKNILTLASDYNWWCVKVKDKEIQETLYDSDQQFAIENEWGHKEIGTLISILGLENTDI